MYARIAKVYYYPIENDGGDRGWAEKGSGEGVGAGGAAKEVDGEGQEGDRVGE